MTLKRKTVGTYTVTTCNRCNNDMNHIVTALNNDSSIAQVKCMVCGSIHKYKKINLEPKINKQTPSRATSSSSSYYKLFNEAREACSNKVPQKYRISNTYIKNTLIEHSTLGEGVILNSYDFKIEVLFKDGVKILVHNKK